MSPKQRKIKRYRSIYSGPFRGRGPKIFAGLATVVLLAAVGWFSYEPIYNFIMRPAVSDVGSSSSVSADEPVDSGSNALPTAQPEDEPPSQPPEPDTPAVQAERIVYMPEDILLDPSARTRFVAMCEQKGIDGILFDLKNDRGVVNFTTGVAKAQEVGAIAPAAIDLAAFTAQLQAAGIQPIGRLFAFKDPLAAAGDRDLSVLYQDTEWSWLDNSADLGGKPWLNPMSEGARAYILALMEDAIGKGVGEVMLDTVHFPVGYATESASYGVPMPQSERSAALHDFVLSAQETAAAAGGRASLYLSAPNLLDASGAKYGASPAEVAGDHTVLGLMPSLFGNVYNTEAFVLESPVISPYHTVQTVLKALPAQLVGENSTAMLQCYTASNVAALHNKTYTYADIEEQLRAVEESGIHRCILYNPAGDYSLLPDQSAQ